MGHVLLFVSFLCRHHFNILICVNKCYPPFLRFHTHLCVSPITILFQNLTFSNQDWWTIHTTDNLPLNIVQGSSLRFPRDLLKKYIWSCHFLLKSISSQLFLQQIKLLSRVYEDLNRYLAHSERNGELFISRLPYD